MDNLDRGLPFRLDDLWCPTTQNPEDEGTVFEALDTHLPPLELPQEFERLPIEFDIPVLDRLVDESSALGDAEASNHNDLEQDTQPLKFDEPERFLDIWDLEEALAEDNAQPKLRTWEAFERRSAADAERIALLSESAPAAFDVVVSSLEPRNEVGVLPQDYVLRALCNLVLGRASSLFEWDPTKERFVQTLEGASISGVSTTCGGSVIEDLITVGSLMASLRNFVSRTSFSLHGSSAFLALQSCTSSILDAIDESISKQLSCIRSIVQLRHRVNRPRRLLDIVDSLITATRHQQANEDITSTVFNKISLDVQCSDDVANVLYALLARVSSPWLETLADNLGLRGPSSDPLGQSESMVETIDHCIKNCTFIDPDDVDLIRETTLAVKLLRETSPGHRLLAHPNGSIFRCFTDPDTTHRHASQMARQYEGSLTSRGISQESANMESPSDTVSSNASLISADTWQNEDSAQSYLQNLEALMSQSTSSQPSPPTDDLHERVVEFCTPTNDCSQADANAMTRYASTGLLERVRPLIQAQYRLVNGVVHRQLYRHHDLVHHLELQFLFQLLGSGYFVDRLSTSLFSSDVQTAERRRGAKPTGEIMGLRLGTSHEERWPPASSELQLALMGILNEAYSRQIADQDLKISRSGQLPGSLSFAIRELSEEEIDRVLDPNSIYALDFLRLQYTASPPIDAILTADTLKVYDGIFRFLLRLLRVAHVTTNLPRKRVGKDGVVLLDKQVAAFAAQAQHFVSVLFSHAMDIGIASPWRNFMRTVTRLEASLKEEDAEESMGTKASMGIEGLRQAHESCLDIIRGRLFLKRKQEKLRNAVEKTLMAILSSCFAVPTSGGGHLDGTGTNFHDTFQAFRRAMSNFLELLQEQVNKPPRSILPADTDTDTQDAEVLRLLLTRLDWNDFYSNG